MFHSFKKFEKICVLGGRLPNSLNCNAQFIRIDALLESTQNGCETHSFCWLYEHSWAYTSRPLRFLLQASLLSFSGVSSYPEPPLNPPLCWRLLASFPSFSSFLAPPGSRFVLLTSCGSLEWTFRKTLYRSGIPRLRGQPAVSHSLSSPPSPCSWRLVSQGNAPAMKQSFHGWHYWGAAY